MAQEFYGFFDSTAEDIREYTEADMARFVRTLGAAGVKDEQSLKVEAASEGLNVNIGYGSAIVGEHYYALENDGGGMKTLTLSAPASKPRIDRIALRMDGTSGVRRVGLTVIKGTEADAPMPPALTRTSTTYDLSLARIYLGVGASMIKESDITDERSDAAACGIIRPRGMMIERGRTTVNVDTQGWTKNGQGVYEKTINMNGTIAGSETQRVDIAVTGSQIGRAMLAGGRVDTSGKLTLLCLTAPETTFTLNVVITEAV